MASDKDDILTIIGIGSSAGGLEAIRELVATLPANLPVTYVVVQHMSPHHKSLMTELVARQTELEVADIVDGTVPEPNVIYITPPKTDVILENGLLRLVAPSELVAAPKPSVDRFLLSLADDHGAHTMAMILSGTGSDGAYGVQAIREAGGITIAQDAESAKYDGMPQAAIQTGCVDLVLRPLEIGTHLNKILTSPRDFAAFRQEELADSPLSDLLQILLARTRVDFRDYKHTTVSRRIERRMIALGITDQEEYTQFLRNNPQAVDALFKDLLISVTRFFRDRDEFARLKELLPNLVKDRPTALRVWIAGCATGEEAYSIAMLISEALGGPELPIKEKVQIFATDIDKDALQVARQGIYGNAVLNDIPEDLASKYLIQHGDGVRVTDTLRSAVLFSEHNVCQDPPFQKVDLLCCRNLLIYFDNSLQQKVMTRFHYSMSQDALLFLGMAETVAGSDELFAPDRSGSHIYHKRKLSKNSGLYRIPTSAPFSPRLPEQKRREAAEASNDRQFFEALAKSMGPNSALVTQDCSILRVYGEISPFIEMKGSTKLSMHLDLLKSPLREEARSLVTIAIKNEGMRMGIRHRLAAFPDEEVQLQVFPIVAPKINEQIALVSFTRKPLSPKPDTPIALDADVEQVVTERIADLESEVAVTREALQQTIEELETSNEELQSLNEELQSTNEELQATNEELETSNEELQSTNEELITVNEELQITATELSGRTGELTSVLQSTPLAIVVTDSALQITQMTRAASDLFGVRHPISNPHISQCTLPEGYPNLAPICSEALKLGTTTSQEFNSGGTRVLLSCTPYFDVHGKILGLTMVVTEFPGLAREMEIILEASSVHLMNRTASGRILQISRAFAETLGLSREEALGQNLFDILPEEIGNKVRAQDEAVLKNESGIAVDTLRVSGADPKTTRWLTMERHIYDRAPNEAPSIYSIAADVTDVIGAFSKSHALLQKFHQLERLAGYGYWELHPQTRQVFWSPKTFELHGVAEADTPPPYDEAVNFYHPDDVPMVEEAVAKATESGTEFEFEARLIRADKKEIRVISHGFTICNTDGEVTNMVGTIREAGTPEAGETEAAE